MERRRREGDPQSDQDKELLENLWKEAGQWAEQAKLLVREVGKETAEEPAEPPEVATVT